MTNLKPPIAPMEALSIDTIPTGDGWQYEPKWDGFRCLAFRNKGEIYLQSKAQKPLGRYFPEIDAGLGRLKAERFVLDGELVVSVAGRFDFDQLLQRIHPAASRVRKLAAEYPALFVVFDLLADADGTSLLETSLEDRRRELERFAKKYFRESGVCRLSPSTRRLDQAKRWFRAAGGNLDGLIAKRIASPYRAGERDAMVKIKQARTADCVVGGFRYASHGSQVGSLLLGLYDDDGLLHHVGFTANIRATERAALTKKLEKLVGAPGFTGRAPGGPSRWSTKRSSEWQPLIPKLVVEVAFDHFSGGRFRHGTSFMRWRPDKAPEQCTFGQVQRKGADVRLLKAVARA